MNQNSKLRATGSPRVATRVLLALLLIGFSAILVRTAWLCDDAYITFRTVDNFQSGLGLTWNPGERVQAYTHPLWMLLVSGVTYLTGDLYETVLAMGISLTIATALVVIRCTGVGLGSVTSVLVLCLSRAFVDYSTSGLEDPLSHLLLAIFLWLFLSTDRDVAAPNRVFVLALLAALATTTRMDTLLFYAPALLTLLLARKHAGSGWSSFTPLILGFAPFLAWEVFSLIYYGFPFPNSAYAKLGTGIPSDELIAQGFAYLDNSFDNDPLTLIAMAAGLVICFTRRLPRSLPVVLGSLFYLLYVVKIGGDFMSGRMLTLPLLATAILLGRGVSALSRPRAALFPLAIIAIGFAAPFPNPTSGADFGPTERIAETGDGRGIVDERRFYYRATGFLSPRRTGDMPAHAWAVRGREAKLRSESPVTRHTIGYFGYYAGPRIHIVDLNALSDPLLARIPRLAPPRPKDRRKWRIGHFTRALPTGYIESLKSGDNEIGHSELAFYYDRLQQVISGPLFSVRRWSEIVAFNLGLHEGWMDSYLETLE